MSVLKYFKNIPRSPPIGRQTLIVIFFFKFAMKSLAEKNNARGLSPPPTGDRPLSPTPGATGSLPLYKPWPPFPCHLSLRIQEKREG